MTQKDRRPAKKARRDPFNGATGPHVAMLVHTSLGPDTRVIKQLHSLVERGYRVSVLVLGVSMDLSTLPGVEVITVSVNHKRSTHASIGRSLRMRNPLAYKSVARGARQRVRLENQLTDFQDQIDARRSAGDSQASILAGKVLKVATLKRLSLNQRRIQLTSSTARARRQADGPVDQLTTKWWTTVQGNRAWRRLWPQIWDTDAAYGSVLDRIKPDLIQANDFMMLAVGARAKHRAEAAGRPVALVWDAREFLPGMESWSPNIRWRPAMEALEAEFALAPDRVITVSDPLADLLVREHGLPERPLVVTNAPEVKDPPKRCETDVRTASGVGPDVPLIVYSGAAAPSRGIELLVRAMVHLPEAHLALVVLPPHIAIHAYVEEMLELARELGVQDRVHPLEYVDNMEVVDFLSTATVGTFPGQQILNHTISLITKFMEYAHARLPIVVSDVKTMAEAVTEHQIGAVFTADDVDSFVEAVKPVLANPEKYKVGYADADLLHEWSWSVQAEVQEQAYREALARVGKY